MEGYRTWVAKIDWRAQGNAGASRGGAEGAEGEKGVQGPHAEAQRVRGQSEGLTQRRRVRRGCGDREGLTRRRGVRGDCNDAQRAMICMHPCPSVFSSVVQTAFSIHLRDLRHLWLRTMERPPEAGRGMRGAHAEAQRTQRVQGQSEGLTRSREGGGRGVRGECDHSHRGHRDCIHPRPSAFICG